MRGVENGKGSAPFLSKYAEPRDEGPGLPGYFSADQNLWMVESPNGAVPLISYARELAAITTKTKVEDESDDESANYLLEITTKTDGNTEGDDQTRHGSALLEVSTKTHAELEREDVSPSTMGLL